MASAAPTAEKPARKPRATKAPASGETMASASYIEVSVKDGQAHVPAAALHLHAGFGYSF